MEVVIIVLMVAFLGDSLTVETASLTVYVADSGDACSITYLLWDHGKPRNLPVPWFPHLQNRGWKNHFMGCYANEV